MAKGNIDKDCWTKKKIGEKGTAIDGSATAIGKMGIGECNTA